MRKTGLRSNDNGNQPRHGSVFSLGPVFLIALLVAVIVACGCSPNDDSAIKTPPHSLPTKATPGTTAGGGYTGTFTTGE